MDVLDNQVAEHCKQNFFIGEVKLPRLGPWRGGADLTGLQHDIRAAFMRPKENEKIEYWAALGREMSRRRELSNEQLRVAKRDGGIAPPEVNDVDMEGASGGHSAAQSHPIQSQSNPPTHEKAPAAQAEPYQADNFLGRYLNRYKLWVTTLALDWFEALPKGSTMTWETWCYRCGPPAFEQYISGQNWGERYLEQERIRLTEGAEWPTISYEEAVRGRKAFWASQFQHASTRPAPLLRQEYDVGDPDREANVSYGCDVDSCGYSCDVQERGRSRRR